MDGLIQKKHVDAESSFFPFPQLVMEGGIPHLWTQLYMFVG
jgi:hypothetical protein